MNVYRVTLYNNNPFKGRGFVVTSREVVHENEVQAAEQVRDEWNKTWEAYASLDWKKPMLDIRARYVRAGGIMFQQKVAAAKAWEALLARQADERAILARNHEEERERVYRANKAVSDATTPAESWAIKNLFGEVQP